MSDNKITCEAINANKIKCAYAARYSVVDGRVLCGTHLKKEKLVADKVLLKPRAVKSKSSTKNEKIDNTNVCSENNKIVEIFNTTFDILNLPTEIIYCIVDFCDFKSQLLFSLLSNDTRVMFPKLANINKDILLEHIASHSTVEELTNEASVFKIKITNNGKLCKMVVKNNSNYDVIKHVLGRNKSGSNIASICKNNDIGLSKQILSKIPNYAINNCLVSAVKNNKCELFIHILDICDHRYINLYSLFFEASKLGRLDCIIALIQRGHGHHLRDCYIELFAEYGHLDCLVYVRENGFTLTPNVLIKTIKGGHFDCFKFLIKLEVSYSNHTFTKTASRYGRLDCLKYLHENDYAWTATACSSAAEKGHLDCLKYLHENGCKWDKRSYKMALKNKHILCEKYLFDNNCPRF